MKKIRITDKRRRVLEVLSRAKKKLTAAELTDRTDLSGKVLFRDTRPLNEAGLINIEDAGNRRLHSITNKGIKCLKQARKYPTLSMGYPIYHSSSCIISSSKNSFTASKGWLAGVGMWHELPYGGGYRPRTSVGLPASHPGEAAKTHYEALASFWNTLGVVENVTLSVDPCEVTVRVGKNKDCVKDGGGCAEDVQTRKLRGFAHRCEGLAEAIDIVRRRENLSNLWFCPADVLLVIQPDGGRPKKKFRRARCLWLDLDMRDEGKSLPYDQRNAKLSEAIQEFIYDKLEITAIVDTGGGYHFYFRLQNWVRNEERFKRALKSLSSRYKHLGADPRTAHPTANMRLPYSINFKRTLEPPHDQLDTRLIHLQPDSLNSLYLIEKHLLRLKSWKKVQLEQKFKRQQAKQSVSQPDSASEQSHQRAPHGHFGHHLWSDELFSSRVKEGYIPEGKSRSEGDFSICCQAILRGMTRDSIIDMILDPNNMCGYSSRDKKKRDRKWVERTYEKALLWLKMKNVIA